MIRIQWWVFKSLYKKKNKKKLDDLRINQLLIWRNYQKLHYKKLTVSSHIRQWRSTKLSQDLSDITKFI